MDKTVWLNIIKLAYMVITHLKAVFILFAFTLIAGAGFAQVDTSVTSDTVTVRSGFVKKLQEIGAAETNKSIEKQNQNRLAARQTQLLKEIRKAEQHAKIYLRKGIDTTEILSDLKEIKASISIVNDGIFVNQGSAQTQRNLTVSTAILSELLKNVNDHKNTLATYINTLIGYRYSIDSLSSDSALYTFSKDSAIAVRYIKKMVVVAREIGPTDTAITESLASVQELQTELEQVSFGIQASLEDIDKMSADLAGRAFDRDFSNISGPVLFARPFSEILHFSLAKEWLAINFYLKDNLGRLIIFILLIATATYFLRSLKAHVASDHGLQPDFKKQLVLRYPFLSAFIVVTSVYQFVFLDPPFIFSFCLWFLSAICLAIVFREYVAAGWMRFWIIMVFLFVLASFDNLVLQASRSERWFMLVLSLTGAAYGGYSIFKGRRQDLREKGIIYFIGFVFLLEIAAVIFNISGRYNLSKTFMVCGFTGIVIAVLFLWTVRLLNEGLALTASVYRHPDKKFLYINFDRIGDKVPVFFYYFLMLGWLILVGRNFYSFTRLANQFNNFLTEERILGDYTFTINRLFIFLIVLMCSVLLSRIISFFASEPNDTFRKEEKTGGVAFGSWLLLIRIFIISTGLFLAFAATGLPLDKLTIVLGALSVGVGLGLQGLVNNLVSGLIIAFERPVNVGDSIELNGKPAILKSIGFRSSVITLADGASLIVPNGDLLSQHLVNWTMSRNTRRLTVEVGVAYGSDLEKVKNILEEILEKNEGILDYPIPVVVAKSFSHSSIDFEILFWVRNMKDSRLIVNEVISSIDSSFKGAGIVIPFPQQDLHITMNNPAD